MKEFIKEFPILGKVITNAYWRIRRHPRVSQPFQGTRNYWQDRYATGGNSGAGSYGKFAQFKAEVINNFVREHNIQSVIEFGCGDGNQLQLAEYPSYLGLDISKDAVGLCRKQFTKDPRKRFLVLDEYSGETADLVLSLDVIYHLVEDEVFDSYMRALLGASREYAIIYSSNTDENRGYENTYIKHRRFTKWVDTNASGWALVSRLPNKYPYSGNYLEGSFADFFIYRKDR